jgi:peptidoglycan/LPS O-acetylase OafA/YrhL
MMTSGHKSDKTNTLDFANALTAVCILSVLLIHYDNYTLNIFPFFFNDFFHITLPKIGFFWSTLVGFSFLSGYKLTLSKNPQSFKEFWLRRFIRVYPLYLIAVILFALLVHPHSSPGSIIVHILALQGLFPDLFGSSFLTLHYIGILFLYYLAYQLTHQYLKQPKQYLMAHLVILVFSFALHLWKPLGYTLFDIRYFLYYPFFVAGVFCALSRKTIHSFFTRIFHFLSFPWLSQTRTWQFIVGTTNNSALATYPIFLFHRPFWQTIINLVPERQMLQWLLVVVFGFPALFIGGYFIQISYNKIIDKIIKAAGKQNG